MPTYYDYSLDLDAGFWVAWKDLVMPYEHDFSKVFSEILVPTEDSTKITWILKRMNKVNYLFTRRYNSC